MINKIFSNKKNVYFVIENDLKMENVHFFYEDFIREDDFVRKSVFVDLSKTRFIDSSGVGALIQISEFLKQKSSKLLIIGINKSINTMFHLSGLNQVFTIIDKEKLKSYLSEEEISLISER
ncbi:MAG: STAS domain-containing protein [Leptospiraceae bacterium]|nr:STAS domain-containing protein [Leptospiraceae bacterium]MDW7975085.1 STAS domain-containing protein [Leptospiraceae bacterium]